MFEPHIRIGETLSESQIHEVFECQTQLGIRLSKKNNLIVLISKLFDNVYSDTWDQDVLYYTGTDASSDEYGQTLFGQGNNNGQLISVWEGQNRPTLYLFEKPAPNKCIYKGIVEICQKPYQEPKQPGSSYLVWRFPLKLVQIDENQWASDNHEIEMIEIKKSLGELEEEVASILRNPFLRKERIIRTLTTNRFDKKALFSAYVKKRANGYCDLCGNIAPFTDQEGNPYLEAHHIERLSAGGIDSPDNMVALCPNCHKKIHHLNLQEDNDTLIAKSKQYRRFDKC